MTELGLRLTVSLAQIAAVMGILLLTVMILTLAVLFERIWAVSKTVTRQRREFNSVPMTHITPPISV